MKARALCVVLLVGGACARSPTQSDGPSATQTDSIAATPSVEGTVAPPGADPRPIGRWMGQSLCLRLFANGDFELSVLDQNGPKVLIMGAAEFLEGDASSATLRLSPRRIWHARWVGPCRREHVIGDWAQSQSALGVTFAPGGDVTLKVTRHGEDDLEICAETCMTMKRAEPLLGARWRLEGLESPSFPSVTWDAGELLEFDITASSAHVWAGTGPGAFVTVYGSTEITPLGGDRYTVTFTPSGLTDKHDGNAYPLYGRPLSTGTGRAFSVRRLAKQRIEVCDGEDHCTTLDRQFDSYAYDLD